MANTAEELAGIVPGAPNEAQPWADRKPETLAGLGGLALGEHDEGLFMPVAPIVVHADGGELPMSVIPVSEGEAQEMLASNQ